MKPVARLFPAFIILGWTVLALVIGLGPEVALDDSWNYAQMTQRFLDEGVIEFSHYDSAMLVLHILWSALVTRVIGFSLVHCTAANLIAAGLALLVLYFMARRFKLSPRAALLVVAATAACPPFLVTAFTCLADFWYLIPAWLSLAFMFRFLETDKPEDVLLGSLWAALSLWNRTHGLLLVAAYLFVLILHVRRMKRPFVSLLIAGGLPALSFLLLKMLTPTLHPVRTTLERKSAEIWTRLAEPVWLARDSADRLGVILLSLGLYALPFLLLSGRIRIPEKINPRRLTVLVACSVIALGAGAYFFFQDRLYPFTSSVWREWPPLVSPVVEYVMTILAVLGAIPLLYFLLASLVRPAKAGGASRRLAWLAGLLQGGALLLLVYFMDRYFLVFIPLAMMLAADPATPAARADRPVRSPRLAIVTTLLGLLLLLSLFTVNGLRVRQYRNGVATQWQAADRLVEQGIDPMMIDGGYSWVGWHNFPACRKRRGENHLTPLDSHYVVEICPAMEVEYEVLFHQVPSGYRLVDTEEYADPFAGKGIVYVYQRPYPRALREF